MHSNSLLQKYEASASNDLLMHLIQALDALHSEESNMSKDTSGINVAYKSKASALCHEGSR